MGLLDRYVVRKRKRQVSSSEESDVVHIQSAELSQPASNVQLAADGISGDLPITIPGSPELGPTGESEPNGAGQPESNVGDPTPLALQVILPPDQGEERPCKLKFTRSGFPSPPIRLRYYPLTTFLPAGRSPREWKYWPLG